ncbi:hypothetical protein AAFC00_004482 [Neodothiora populina]|uniref:PLC-like phosphodiesterase n=1 Tax=Neodothiora populina TaxID=2781224 RepID=A0ABR3P2P1_9PEZI
MLSRNLWLVALLAVGSYAQSSDESSSSESSSSSSSSSRRASGSSSSGDASIVTLAGTASGPDFTGSQYTYASVSGQLTASDLYTSRSRTSSSSSASSTGTCTHSSCSSASGSRTSSVSTITSTSKGSTSIVSLLVGGGGVVTQTIVNGTVTLSAHQNATATTSSTSSSSGSTSSSAAPTNTQPCNGWPEFCNRKYGNITEVCAHNAAFSIKGNAASNQDTTITQQLNDGVRMIQGETQWVNNTIYNCHTSCDLLNAGTWQSGLEEVAAWVRDHPYDVVTLLIVNSQFIYVDNYTAPLQASGLGPYLYEPPYIPMRLDQWPTLSEMILTQKRVVVFMDYMADQTTVPYILDEFTHMWETPFSPTDTSFPCDIQRPPGLNETVGRDERMYMANHNLNAEISLLGNSFLVPNTAELNVTNAAGLQQQMLGANAGNCTERWGRPPNFLLVDYYDNGNGSVFEVAAKHNNVTYDRACCGIVTSDAVRHSGRAQLIVAAAAVAFAMSLAW